MLPGVIGTLSSAARRYALHPSADHSMPAQHVFFARGDEVGVLHDQPAVHHRVARRYGAATQPRLDGIGERARERDALQRPAHEVTDRAGRQRPISPARPRHPAEPRVAISSASRAPVEAGPRRNRPSKSALRASIHSDAESVDAEPSQPRPTGTPAARNSATGAIPPPPMSMFELGQCATPVPHPPSRAISAEFG